MSELDEIDNVVEFPSAAEHSYSRPAFGTWNTETESAAEFDRRVDACGLFARNYKEVTGYLLARRPNRQNKDTRIDRILMPGPDLVKAGWTQDIGVELKRSGEKLGPALAQAIDYTWCAWNVGHHWLMLEHVFLWPFPKQGGAPESIMLQNGCGVIFETRNSPLVFQLEKQVIRIERDKSFTVQPTNSGRKVGSR